MNEKSAQALPGDQRGQAQQAEQEVAAKQRERAVPDRMVVADPLAVFQHEGMIKVIAPAKTNLFLGIGELREDGFHEVTTVLHALSLHDVLHMDYRAESAGGLVIEVACYAREGLESLDILPDENIALLAIRRLAEKMNRAVDETIKIRIEKHIPFQAGLGGGSSDAAAALVGAAHFWKIDPLSPEVLDTASEIGSDVVFFLYGACACLTGRGDIFDHSIEPMKEPLVIIKPANGVSTALAYQAFDKVPVSIPPEILERVKRASSAEEVPLFNNMTAAAEAILPQIKEVMTWAEAQEGVRSVFLSGSGSAVIALCENFDRACGVSSAARMQGWWTRATSFSSVRAALIPRRGQNFQKA